VHPSPTPVNAHLCTAHRIKARLFPLYRVVISWAYMTYSASHCLHLGYHIPTVDSQPPNENLYSVSPRLWSPASSNLSDSRLRETWMCSRSWWLFVGTHRLIFTSDPRSLQVPWIKQIIDWILLVAHIFQRRYLYFIMLLPDWILRAGRCDLLGHDRCVWAFLQPCLSNSI